MEITHLLMKLGFKTNLNGYHYVREAILLNLHESYIDSFNKALYTIIAEKFNSSEKNVDRSIRYSISKAIIEGNINNWKLIFPYLNTNSNYLPSSSEFISTISELMKL